MSVRLREATVKNRWLVRRALLLLGSLMAVEVRANLLTVVPGGDSGPTLAGVPQVPAEPATGPGAINLHLLANDAADERPFPGSEEDWQELLDPAALRAASLEGDAESAARILESAYRPSYFAGNMGGDGAMRPFLAGEFMPIASPFGPGGLGAPIITQPLVQDLVPANDSVVSEDAGGRSVARPAVNERFVDLGAKEDRESHSSALIIVALLALAGGLQLAGMAAEKGRRG